MNWSSHSMRLSTPTRRFWNWGPLIFSGFYFLPLVFSWERLSATDLVMQFISFVAFVGLYAIALDRKGANVFPVLIGMMLVCSFASQYTLGTQSLFGYIAYFCGFSFLFPINVLMLVLLLGVVSLNGLVIIPDAEYYFWGPAVLLSVGLFAFGWMEQRERVHYRREQQSQQQLEQMAAIAERERIARDLHDVLGHSLSSIALKAELSSKLLNAGQTARAAIESAEVAALARDLLSEVREAVSGLKAKGVHAEIEHAVELLNKKGIVFERNIQHVELDATKETALAMVLREAITNIIKHSKATHVIVSLWQDEQQVNLSIRDNGKVSNLHFGNGLTGIKERIEALHGTLELKTNNDLSMQISLPVKTGLMLNREIP
ncbi:sensor histidine kinase [Pseudoalteromonas luteoviolacea B = ATCC 29581]|nr:sensor histidine kinase [Pseudoalteromonas luteoviolacea B = ATCC 29581]